jgi:hypothetical protein
MLRNYWIMLYVALHTLLLGCSLFSTERIQPIVTENSGGGLVAHRLRISANCADFGEEVIFTVEIRNNTDVPLPIKERPPFDIILRPVATPNDPAQFIRWSETDQYPPDVDPVLAPKEERTYSWRWIADAKYATPSVFVSGVNVDVPLTVQFEGGGEDSSPVSPPTLGVGAHPYIGGRGMFCEDLR